MPRLNLASVGLVSLLLCASCASILPGNDPVVVNAERTTATAAQAFDSFLTIERRYEAEIKKVSPQIHVFANQLRRRDDGITPNGIRYVESANKAIEAYKQNRTPENKASLNTALAVLQSVLLEAKSYTAQAGQLTPRQ